MSYMTVSPPLSKEFKLKSYKQAKKIKAYICYETQAPGICIKTSLLDDCTVGQGIYSQTSLPFNSL